MGCLGTSNALFQQGQRNQKFNVSGNQACPCFYHKGSGDKGIVVIQQWWGLNRSIIKTALQFSVALGASVVVPDLYRGSVAKDHQEAGHKMTGLDFGKAVADIDAARAFLQSRGCKKIYLIGFCMGGALTIATVSNCKGFSKAFPFYGIPDLTKVPYKNIQTPLYAFFGSKDDQKGFSDVDSAKKFQQTLQKAGKKIKLTIVDGAGHAFMNKDSPNFSATAYAQCFAAVCQEIKS